MKCPLFKTCCRASSDEKNTLTLSVCFGTFVLLSLCFFVSSALARPGVNIVTSIKPLALLAKDLGGQFVEAKSIISGTASPHHYSMRPSDVRAINKADLILWVGEDFDRFILRALESIDNQKKISFQFVERRNEAYRMEVHSHNENAKGTHIWLDPERTIYFAQKLSEKLIKLRPENKDEFETRLTTFVSSVLKQKTDTRKQLNQYSNKRFMAYHESYRYIIEAYAVEQLGALTKLPQEMISAKKLSMLKKSTTNAACLLANSLESEKANRYAKILNLKLVKVDILANKQNLASFIDYTKSISESLIRCFSSEDAEKNPIR